MTKTIEQPLRDLGMVLPSPAKSVATYVPVVRTGNLLATFGQLPLKDGALAAPGRQRAVAEVASRASEAKARMSK